MFHITFYSCPINILEQFKSSSRTQVYKIEELVKNSSDHFAGVHKYSRNTNLLSYVNLRFVNIINFAQRV